MRIIIHFYLFDFQFCDIHLTKGNGKFPFILFYSYFDMWFRFAFYLFNKSLIFICNNHDDSIFFFVIVVLLFNGNSVVFLGFCVCGVCVTKITVLWVKYCCLFLSLSNLLLSICLYQWWLCYQSEFEGTKTKHSTTTTDVERHAWYNRDRQIVVSKKKGWNKCYYNHMIIII